MSSKGFERGTKNKKEKWMLEKIIKYILNSPITFIMVLILPIIIWLLSLGFKYITGHEEEKKESIKGIHLMFLVGGILAILLIIIKLAGIGK